MMVFYEIKKVFSKNSNKIIVIILAALLFLVSYIAIHDVTYVDAGGKTHTGIKAARNLREVKKSWEGPLTVEKLQRIIDENNTINQSKEAKSKNINDNNIAFANKQGFEDIRMLLNYAYGDFQSFDYFLADSLKSEDAKQFYNCRVENLKKWLYNDVKDQFTENEKQFLITRYQAMTIPLFYECADGWDQLFYYTPMIFLILALAICYLVTDIFSSEKNLKSDAIFFSTYHGRKKAVASKLKAGLIITTALYWIVVILYSCIVLSALGSGGSNMMIQASTFGWKSFYNISVWKEYLIIICAGYLGCLVFSLVTMLVSAKTKKAVIAIMTSFILIILPSYLTGIKLPYWDEILAILPDRLLQIKGQFSQFILYNIGDIVIPSIPILFIVHILLCCTICPVIYRIYKNTVVK